MLAAPDTYCIEDKGKNNEECSFKNRNAKVLLRFILLKKILATFIKGYRSKNKGVFTQKINQKNYSHAHYYFQDIV